MVKKTSFGPDFSPFGAIQTVNFFSQKSGCQALDVMVSYHHVQYQKKLMIQS